MTRTQHSAVAAHLVALVLTPAFVFAIADLVLGVVGGVIFTLPSTDAILTALITEGIASSLGPSRGAKLVFSTVLSSVVLACACGHGVLALGASPATVWPARCLLGAAGACACFGV